MRKIILATMVIMATLGCTKEGKQGEPGAAGKNGTNGTDGNANVIGTQTVAVNSGNWNANAGSYFIELAVNGLTQEILDKGAVLCYEQNGSIWNAMPYSYGNLTRTYTFELNKVTIFYQNQSGTTANPGNRTYRLVLVAASGKVVNIDWNNYYEVKGAFNLPE